MGANNILAWNVHEEHLSRARFLLDTPFRSRRMSWVCKVDVAADCCVRALYLFLGVSLTIIGVVAIALPLVPATTTLLASSCFLTTSCPRLQLALKQTPLLGKFLKYLDGTRVMSTSTRYGIIVYLWTNLIVTLACLHCICLATYPIASINILCCALSTIFLFSFRAEPAKKSQDKVAAVVALTQSNAVQPHPMNQPLPLTDEAHICLSDSNPKLTHVGYVPVGLPNSATATERPAP